MKIDKVEICMNAVEAVKITARNIGMVCKNCGSIQHVVGEGYFCKAWDSEIPYVDGFCNLFHFRDEKACQEFWEMCVKEAEKEKEDETD